MRRCANCNSWWVGGTDEFCGVCGTGLTDFEIQLYDAAVWVEATKQYDIPVTIRNVGQNDVEVEAITFGPSSFPVSHEFDLPLSLPPGKGSTSSIQGSIRIECPDADALRDLSDEDLVVRAKGAKRDREQVLRIRIKPVLKLIDNQLILVKDQLHGVIRFKVISGAPQIGELESDSNLFEFETCIKTDYDEVLSAFHLEPRIFETKPEKLSVRLNIEGADDIAAEIYLRYPKNRLHFGDLQYVAGDLPSNRKFEADIEIGCTGYSDVSIVKVSVEPAHGFTIDTLEPGLSLQPDDRITFKLHFDPEAYLKGDVLGSGENRIVNARLKLESDSVDEPVADIPIFITLRPTAYFEEYVGLDFGTSNSCVAVGDDELATLDMVIYDRETKPQNILPSVIFVGNQDGECTYEYGEQAASHRFTEPSQVVSSVKKLLGHRAGGEAGRSQTMVRIVAGKKCTSSPP